MTKKRKIKQNILFFIGYSCANSNSEVNNTLIRFQDGIVIILLF